MSETSKPKPKPKPRAKRDPRKGKTPEQYQIDMDRSNKRAISRLEVLDGEVDKNQEYTNLVEEIEGKTVHTGFIKWTAEEKIRAVTAYVATGSMDRASEICGVPLRTIKYWKSTAKWWESTVDFARRERKEKWDAKLSEIMELGYNYVSERLKDGDDKLVKQKVYKAGKVIDEQNVIIKVPIPAKEAMAIASAARHDQALLIGEPTAITAKSSGEDTLKKIADKLMKAVNGKVIEGTVVREKDNES